MVDCQCRDCQRKSGTGHGSYLTFGSREAVKLTGHATHWDMIGDSGNVKTRGFCPTCGVPVYLTSAAMPEFFSVHAASLDDPARYQPQAVIFRSSGHDWDRVDLALPQFEKMPPIPGEGCDRPRHARARTRASTSWFRSSRGWPGQARP